MSRKMLRTEPITEKPDARNPEKHRRGVRLLQT